MTSLTNICPLWGGGGVYYMEGEAGLSPKGEQGYTTGKDIISKIYVT